MRLALPQTGMHFIHVSDHALDSVALAQLVQPVGVILPRWECDDRFSYSAAVSRYAILQG